jgi:hypothetical protein
MKIYTKEDKSKWLLKFKDLIIIYYTRSGKFIPAIHEEDVDEETFLDHKSKFRYDILSNEKEMIKTMDFMTKPRHKNCKNMLS